MMYPEAVSNVLIELLELRVPDLDALAVTELCQCPDPHFQCWAFCAIHARARALIDTCCRACSGCVTPAAALDLISFHVASKQGRAT